MAGGMIHLVKIIETRPPDVTIRRWRDVRKTVMRTMGLHWHQNILPKHFAPNAPNVYHYRRRTSKYLDTKAKAAERGSMAGKQIDPSASYAALTLTGTLRRNVTQAATVRAFEQRFKLIMPGTPYTPDRPRTTKQPPLAQEVTTLLEYEKADMSKLGKATAVRELQAIRSPTTTNIT